MMGRLRDCAVVIAGAGPAGLATALYLLRRRPELAGRAVEVIRGEARTPVGSVDLSRRGDVLCTIVRRDWFDAMLARAAVRAGLEIIENERVVEVGQDADGVRVGIGGGTFKAKVLVG